MLFNIPDVLKPDQARLVRQKLENAQWVDGRLTAGQQAAKVKSNRELKKGQSAELEAGAMIRQALDQNKLFNMVALPFKVSPPLFNRYEEGESDAPHIDNAIRQGTDETVGNTGSGGTCPQLYFFLNPRIMTEGELVVEDTYGVQKR